MNCSCGEWNQEGEHRCRRCRRRLPAQPVPAGSAVPVPASAPEPAESPSPSPAPALRVVRRTALQQSLFGREGASRVVAMKGATLRAQRRREAEPRLALPVEQRRLDFPIPSPARTSDPVICCRAPVASREHRVLGAMVGLSLVLIGLAMAAAVYLAWGGEVVLNRPALFLVCGAFAAVAVWYQLLFAVAGGDTPSMSFTGLQLLDFDGRRPSVKKRLIRVAATCVSVGAAGLGLMWALVDEDHLTWQDHISKTFPTLRVQKQPRS